MGTSTILSLDMCCNYITNNAKELYLSPFLSPFLFALRANRILGFILTGSAGRIRTYDRSVTRILLFPIGVDYIITLLFS
ncbi:MAG: hypothetical protein Greene041614_1215 [Parcubacteria group bacterium Greene0416_14]|nr:MAG: hypothetical protein Greene041614_1215 [Parcubacteria group bacterium Greene0416_14]TSD07419.1 MAG: hypothetical protein Greene07144_911 [Parcubacteria group bacterium Greene0714_4]